ncbi:MAG: hypothetical protein KJ718_05140 [Nanoarchaeota archaeon]|nr:hypothetical protein [Nanoarchaeota archaeon]MBU1051911.1 hypothetical protein [Nanoarchaeota archaeon]MBU1988954.1 hypothetical protein [Nanoarchaeota archaeon]
MRKEELVVLFFILMFFTFSVFAEKSFAENSEERYIVKSHDGELFVVEGINRDELSMREDIVYFEEDYPVRALDGEETPWNFQVIGINFSEISGVVCGFGNGVRIAVLDTGVDYNLLNVSLGYDFINDDPDPLG